MLDMDGTILDLAFDNYVWKELVVGRYAEHTGLEYKVARDRLCERYMSIQGDLEWYCLDHWSDRLGFEVRLPDGAATQYVLNYYLVRGELQVGPIWDEEGHLLAIYAIHDAEVEVLE